MAGIDRGCLLVADISGYTRFLRGVELQHSTDVLADVMGVVVNQLSGVSTLAKLEGDAAFCFERGACTGQALMTAVIGCYSAFRRRIRDITHLTTCECAACREIPGLDLKIVAHRGEFLVHTVAGSEELTGPDVILVHRLLKNSVTAGTGLVGYALLTGDLVSELAMDAAGMGLVARVEPTDDIGDVSAFLLDLTACWQDEERRSEVVVGSDDAMHTMVFEMPAAPA